MVIFLSTLDPRRVPTDSMTVLLGSFLPELLLISSLSFLGAVLAGSYLGGGMALAALGAIALGANANGRFPIRLLDAPPESTDSPSLWHHWEFGRGWTLAGAVAFLSLALLLNRKPIDPYSRRPGHHRVAEIARDRSWNSSSIEIDQPHPRRTR